ncbi:hypothetical protein Syun_017483 [Stephania yunnanensis]|uniref:Uncharacterized protein n=1 Tax=Stephania yunnanensis TaxID=152371 RepID=A0AAP0J995_9MAGN
MGEELQAQQVEKISWDEEDGGFELPTSNRTKSEPDRDGVTVANAFDMADRVIVFLSAADDTYETTRIATQSEKGTTSTEAAHQYSRKGKQARVKS